MNSNNQTAAHLKQNE